jgi:hypothetical protein
MFAENMSGLDIIRAEGARVAGVWRETGYRTVVTRWSLWRRC